MYLLALNQDRGTSIVYLGFLYLNKQLLDVSDDGMISLLDPDTGDTRDDLPLPVEPELADEISGAISDGKDILVRKINIYISSYSMMNSKNL